MLARGPGRGGEVLSKARERTWEWVRPGASDIGQEQGLRLLLEHARQCPISEYEGRIGRVQLEHGRETFYSGGTKRGCKAQGQRPTLWCARYKVYHISQFFKSGAHSQSVVFPLLCLVLAEDSRPLCWIPHPSCPTVSIFSFTLTWAPNHGSPGHRDSAQWSPAPSSPEQLLERRG